MNKGNPLVEQLRKFGIQKAFNYRNSQPLKNEKKLIICETKWYQMSFDSFLQHSPQINLHQVDVVQQKTAETEGRERSLYTKAPFSREDSGERDYGPLQLWTASRISPAPTQHDFAFSLSQFEEFPVSYETGQ